MRKGNSSDGILVFDRYYTRKPISALLILQRVLFCAGLSAVAMLYVFSQFGLAVSLGAIGAASAVSAAVFLLLFTFFGRRFTAPAIAVIAAAIIFFNFEQFWLRFSYFVDEAMLLVEGRFLFPRGYLLHPEAELTPLNPLYSEGVLLGSVLLCILYSLLCALTMKRRIRVFPALIGFVVLCVPRLLSETLEMNLWFVFAALLVAAAAAVELNYKNGLAVTRAGSSTYKTQVREEERSFNRNARKAPFLKRIGMKASFYSKYATSGVCCIVIFALAFTVGMNTFGQGSSIDYVSIYESIFKADNTISDSESQGSDKVSDYFSSPDKLENSLNVTSPGKGDQSIIRVSFTGDKNIYLRGDIGIRFSGTSWTTPIQENEIWLASGLDGRYRPAEATVLRAVLDALM